MFLLNTHRETNCSHNPTGPPREIEVLISFAPEAASTAHHWLLQRVTGDQISACWTVQGPVAFSTQLSQFHVSRCTGRDGTFSGNEIAVSAVPCYWWDITWQGWSPISGSAESLPSPPWGQGRGQCPALLLHTMLHTTHVQWHGNYMLGVETALQLPPHRGYLLASNVSWAIFSPLSPSLSPSPPPSRSSPSKDDEMPRRNVTAASKFALGHKLHFDNSICSVGGQIPLCLPFLVLTIISCKYKVH